MLNSRFVYILFGILLVIESLLLCYTFYKLYEENNDIEFIFNDNYVIQISSSPITYISKRDKGVSAFINYMNSQGYEFIEEKQEGLRHCFKKNNEYYYYFLEHHKYYLEWFLDI